MMITKQNFRFAALGAVMTAGIHASAGSIDNGFYDVRNHPDGAASSPFYGLRLDGLLGSDKIVTFDFEAPSAFVGMTVAYNSNEDASSTITITGQAFGGIDNGSSFLDPTVYDIEVVYTNVKKASDGDLFTTGNLLDIGTIKRADGQGDTFKLASFTGNNDYAFRLQNGTYRGYEGISGNGWVNYFTSGLAADSTHAYSSDWLFTAVPVEGDISIVPTPAAAGAGLMALIPAVMRRRRR